MGLSSVFPSPEINLVALNTQGPATVREFLVSNFRVSKNTETPKGEADYVGESNVAVKDHSWYSFHLHIAPLSRRQATKQ